MKKSRSSQSSFATFRFFTSVTLVLIGLSVAAPAFGSGQNVFFVQLLGAQKQTALREKSVAVSTSADATSTYARYVSQTAELASAGLTLSNTKESAMATTLAPGLYTAILPGLNGGQGVGTVEVYDRGP